MRKIRVERVISPVERKALRLLRSPDFFGEIRNALKRQGHAPRFGGAILAYLTAGSASLDEPLHVGPAGPTSAGTNSSAKQIPGLVPARVGSPPAQRRPAQKEHGSKRPALSAQELAIWHEAHRLLVKRCDWLVFSPGWLDTIIDGAPRDSDLVRTLPVLVETMKMSAIIRSFRDPLIGGDPRFPCFIFVDFHDYAMAATLLNGVLAESHHREPSNGEVRKAVTTKFRVGDAGRIARENRTAMGNRTVPHPVPLESQFLPTPEDLIENTPWVRGPIDFVHPLTGEQVTLSPRKRRRS